MTDGFRESTRSRREVLSDLKRRGRTQDPRLAIGDGALGFRAAPREVFATTQAQRCWLHKTLNVLNALPKSVQAKAKAQRLTFDEKTGPRLRQYPLRPLLGELGFVMLRSLGFIAIVATLSPVRGESFPTLVAAFSLAWVMGLVVPGAPGGIGVFEATAIPLLSGQFPVAIVLSSVAVYRLVSVLAEVAAAGGVWAGEQLTGKRVS